MQLLAFAVRNRSSRTRTCAANRTRVRELVAQLHREHFSGLRADSRKLLEARNVALLNRATKLLDANLAEDGDREFRPHVGNAHERAKHEPLGLACEPEERELIFARMGVNRERDLLANLRTRTPKRAKGAVHLVPHTSDVNEGSPVAVGRQKGPAQTSNHRLRLTRFRPSRASCLTFASPVCDEPGSGEGLHGAQPRTKGLTRAHHAESHPQVEGGSLRSTAKEIPMRSIKLVFALTVLALTALGCGDSPAEVPANTPVVEAPAPAAEPAPAVVEAPVAPPVAAAPVAEAPKAEAPKADAKADKKGAKKGAKKSK